MSRRQGKFDGEGPQGSVPPVSLLRVRLLFAASILVPIIFLVGGGWEDLYQLQRQTMRNLFAATAILREEARQVLESQARVMELVDGHFEGRPEPPGDGAGPVVADGFLRQVDDVFDDINGIWVSGEEGRYRASSVTIPKPPDTTAARDYIVAESRAGVAVAIEPTSGAPGVSTVTIFRHRAGTDLPDVTMNVSLEPITRFYQSFRADWARDRSIVLLREDGVALARDPPLDGTDAVRPATERFIPALHRGVRGFHQGVFDGETKERIFGVEKVPGYPVYVAFGITNHSVIQRWYRHLSFFALIAAAMMAAMLVASYVALRSAWREQYMAERLRAALARAATPAYLESAGERRRGA